MVKRISQLGWNVPIVNTDRTPTEEFLIKWNLQASINGSIPLLSTPAQVSAVLDILGSTEGDILRRGASEWSNVPTDDDPSKYLDGSGAYSVPAGTFALPSQTGHAGDFLTTDGTDPSWAAGGGGSGDVVLLNSGTLSAAAMLDVVLSSYTAYAHFELKLINWVLSTNAAGLVMRTSSNGGVSFDAGGGDYKWTLHFLYSEGAGGDRFSNSDSLILVAGDNGANISNAAGSSVSATITMPASFSAALYGRVHCKSDYFSATSLGALITTESAGQRQTAAAVDALRVLASSGTVSGDWRLYGYK